MDFFFGRQFQGCISSSGGRKKKSRRGQSQESIRLQSSGIAICKSQSKFNQVSAREQSVIAVRLHAIPYSTVEFFFWNAPERIRFIRAASRTAACEPRASPGRSEPRAPGRAATKHSPPAARSSRAPHRAASSTVANAPYAA